MLFPSRSRRALLGLLATAAASFAAFEGCASPSGSSPATGADEHTEGELLSVNDPHVWAEASAADFGKGLSTPNGAATRPIAQADPTTVRLQQWLDRYHAIIGDVMRERGESLVAPKPSAAIFKEWGPNAWVSTSFACPDWRVRVPASGSSGDHVFVNGDMAVSTDFGDRCVRPINWTDPAAFASFFNAQSHACKLSTNGLELGVSGSGCSVYGRTAPLATYATSSTIGVTIDAITWGDELRVAQTLAHELGHYYRAHSNPLVRRHTDFFYRDTPSGPDRPVPAAESAQYESVIAQLRSVPTAVRLKTKTRYSKRLASALYGLRSLCPSAQITESNMRGVMSGQITPTNTSAYVSFEASLASCGRALVLDAAARDALDRTLRQARVYLRVSATAQTMDAALVELSTWIDQIDQNEAELVKRMTEGQFGWYTDEQEADDIGLELATRAGFKPADVVAANLRTYEQLDTIYKRAGVDRGDEVSAATCKQWLAAGFTETGTDGVKRPVRVPVGSLSDPHHDACYRIYNLWREAKRHDYVVGAPLPDLSPSWSSIQARAATLGGSQPPALGDDGDDGKAADPEDESASDPEEEAPPPRSKRKPAVVPEADAGGPAMVTVVREGGCAVSSAPSPAPSGLAAAGSLLALTLLVRRRRAPR